ncbi:hypothetical protein PsYK624_043920 [Phanerochaete sordida]|uniref:Uncharacterized protein n=1 Tax=Phanerochaete sordida TaxID=48140 RepID=A0A9P3G6C3_9APHY|nr:hypothetical protein PsYK624_043920 [Phanerochaete sordida]
MTQVREVRAVEVARLAQRADHCCTPRRQWDRGAYALNTKVRSQDTLLQRARLRKLLLLLVAGTPMRLCANFAAHRRHEPAPPSQTGLHGDVFMRRST